MSLSVVVLPQPLSPTMARNSPSLTASSARSTATMDPNFLLTPRSWSEIMRRYIERQVKRQSGEGSETEGSFPEQRTTLSPLERPLRCARTVGTLAEESSLIVWCHLERREQI